MIKVLIDKEKKQFILNTPIGDSPMTGADVFYLMRELQTALFSFKEITGKNPLEEMNLEKSLK